MSTTTIERRARRISARASSLHAGALKLRRRVLARGRELRRDGQALLGLGLIAYGLHGVWAPLAPLATGAVLLWLAIADVEDKARDAD